MGGWGVSYPNFYFFYFLFFIYKAPKVKGNTCCALLCGGVCDGITIDKSSVRFTATGLGEEIYNRRNTWLSFDMKMLLLGLVE